MKRDGMLLCLVGPSGAGKSTYAKKLLSEDNNFSFSISLTTRQPRDGEVNGVQYDFVSVEQFKDYLNAGDLFEWEEIHGNFYGTRASSIKNAISQGHDLLLDIDIKGSFSFKNGFPNNTVIIFLVPPSLEILQSRLKARGSMQLVEFEKRMQTAKNEFDLLLSDGGQKVDYFLINDEIEKTFSKILSIINAERVKLKRLDTDFFKSCCSF